MDPVDYAVPGALLRTAGDGSTGDGPEQDHRVAAPAPLRAHRFDGLPAALVVLALLALGPSPLAVALVLLLGAAAIGTHYGTTAGRAADEDRHLLEAAGQSPDAPLAPVTRRGLAATTERLGRRRGLRDLYLLCVPVGMACFAVPLFGDRLLDRHEHVGSAHRATLLAVVAVVALVLAPLAVVAADRLSRHRPDPDRFACAVAAAWVCVWSGMAALAPSAALFAVLLGVGEAAIVPFARHLTRCLRATVSARERPTAWLMLAVYGVLVGGLVGTVLLDLIAIKSHTRVAMWLVAPAGLAVGLYVAAATGRRTTDREAADLLIEVAERRTAQQRADAGIEPPAVEVRDVDFAFGANPVLRGISLEVAQGEVAALLGTNGAGKSTLLRVIAGLLPADRGTVRLYGEPTTQSGPEALGSHRVALVLGGGMTFPGLTVAETLRLSLLGLEEPADLDEVYGRFPVLWNRRNQRTGTLSGGEQQMLAVGRALLTRPRLLLIDELTLGLAPKIVGDLVDLVDDLAERGTTIVLVEQSVNIATRLATHAFFLERGEVRYDGPTDALLERDDLLRSVFLAAGT